MKKCKLKMLIKFVSNWPESKKLMGFKNFNLLVFFSIFIFPWALSLNLLAETEKTVSLSLKIEEWIVLEITSAGLQATDIGHDQAQVEAIIIPGQPVFVRAFISVGQGKRVILKGTLFSAQKLGSDSNPKLKWQGEGDLIGYGFININEPITFAIWQNNGFKTGAIIFEKIGEGFSLPLKGIFTLHSF